MRALTRSIIAAIFLVLAAGVVAEVKAIGEECTPPPTSCKPPDDVNKDCHACCQEGARPSIEKYDPPEKFEGTIGRNGTSNTISTCSGYGGCYFYDNANVYQCSCGNGLGSQGDILILEGGGSRVTVLCVGGSSVGGDCGDIVAMSLPTCTGGAGLNCKVNVTKLGRMESDCGVYVNGPCYDNACCCEAIQKIRTCTSSIQCMFEWIMENHIPGIDEVSDLYSGLGAPGDAKCNAFTASLIAEMDDLVYNCQCYGNANPNSSTKNALGCDASSNFGDGLCETLAAMFANTCAVEKAIEEGCGDSFADVESKYGLPPGSLMQFGSGIMGADCQNPIDICYNRPQPTFDNINAALVQYAKSHPPGYCVPLNNGSSSSGGGSGSGHPQDGNDGIVCHPNNWADLGYLGYCSNQYTAMKLDIVGAQRLFMSPQQQCYPHKKTFQGTFYDKDNKTNTPKLVGDPLLDPNFVYYYLPKCYGVAEEVRQKNLPLFAQLEAIDKNYRELRLNRYAEFMDELTPKDSASYSGGANLAAIVCNTVSMVVDDIGKPLSVVAVLAVVMMALFGKADWRLLMATATGIAIIFSAQFIVQKIAGGGGGSCGGGSTDQTKIDQSALNEVLQEIHVGFDEEALPIIEEINANFRSLEACRETLLGVDDDFLDEYRAFGCDPAKTAGHVIPEGEAPPLQNKLAMENCVDAHISNHRTADIKDDFFDKTKVPDDVLTKFFDGSGYSKPAPELVENPNVRLKLMTDYGNKKMTMDVFKRGAGICYPLVISPLAVNDVPLPPYQRIYEPNHPFSPRQHIAGPIGKEWLGYPELNGDEREFEQRMCWDELTQCNRSPTNRRVVAIMDWRLGEYTGCEQCLGQEFTRPIITYDSYGNKIVRPCNPGTGHLNCNPAKPVCEFTGAMNGYGDGVTQFAGSLSQLYIASAVTEWVEPWQRLALVRQIEKRGDIKQQYEYLATAASAATSSCGPIPGNYNDYDNAPPYSGPLSIRSDVDQQPKKCGSQGATCGERWETGNTCHQVAFYLPDGPDICGKTVRTHQECCDILTKPVVMDNALPLRMTEDAYSKWQTNEPNGEGDPKSPEEHEGYPHWRHSTQPWPNHAVGYKSNVKDWWWTSFRFGDDFSQEPDHIKETGGTVKSMGILPFMQWWEEGFAHCKGCNDAVIGVGNMHKQCLYGGWEEMKMYQARCYAFFGVHCLCDYEQTFKQGSAEEYVLMRAGTVFDLKLGDEGNVDGMTVVRNATRYWPLSWRGYASDPQLPEGDKDWGESRRFPYLNGDFGTVSSAIKTNLDNARAGDIVIWDYDVSGKTRLPHVAYIEAARTRATCEATHCGDNPTSACGQCGSDTSEYFGGEGPRIEIAEWNFGRFPDACGNTDRWGRETRRTLYKLKDASFAPGGRSLKDYSQPDVLKYNPESTCGDPALSRCWENLWSVTKVYNPTKDVRRGDSYPNTCNCNNDLDGLSEREIHNDMANVEKAVNDRSNGCDPPISLREIPSRPIIGSRTMANISITNTAAPMEASQFEMKKENVSNVKKELTEAPLFANGIGGGSSSSSSGGSSGGTEECPRDPTALPLTRWTTSTPGCSTSAPDTSDTFYSPEEIQSGTFPSNAVSPINPVDKSPRAGAMCQTPAAEECLDPPFCFLRNPNITSCDWQGYMRNVRDMTYPFYTDSRTDPLYRDSGYSNDFVVDYLYYKVGFFDPVANPNASTWMKLMLQYPPIYWLAKIDSNTCWMVGGAACGATTDTTQRLVWILNKNNSTAPIYEVNATVDDNVKPGKTVAIIASDKYYQGIAGIVSSYNATNKCINLASSNWLKKECQEYDDKNCYQVYNSFAQGCVAGCIPLSEVAMMWNPNLKVEPTLPKCAP